MPQATATEHDEIASIQVDGAQMEWGPATQFYGPTAVYQGRDIVQLKVLSDRRREGGGIAWLVRYTPPEDKLSRSSRPPCPTSTSLIFAGGRVTESGAPVRAAGGYKLNFEGQSHSALIGAVTINDHLSRGAGCGPLVGSHRRRIAIGARAGATSVPPSLD